MSAMGHRGTLATLHVLRPYYVWTALELDEGGGVKQYLYCMDVKQVC